MFSQLKLILNMSAVLVVSVYSTCACPIYNLLFLAFQCTVEILQPAMDPKTYTQEF